MKFECKSHPDAFIICFFYLNIMKLISIILFSSLASIAHAQVSLDEARALVGNSSVTVLDIREPDEHATGVAKGMKLIPMSTLESRLNELPRSPNSRLLLICNTQNRSSAVAKELRSRGFTNVEYVRGGMSEWAKRGWTMESPAKP
jgi:rhodanese-related sulfurtransferase